MVDDKYRIWSKELVPALEQNNIFFLRYDELTKEEKQYYTKYFEKIGLSGAHAARGGPVPSLPAAC